MTSTFARGLALAATLGAAAAAQGTRAVATASKTEIAGVTAGDALSAEKLCARDGWTCKTRVRKRGGKTFSLVRAKLTPAASKDFESITVKIVDGKAASLRGLFRATSLKERMPIIRAYLPAKGSFATGDAAAKTSTRLVGNAAGIQMVARAFLPKAAQKPGSGSEGEFHWATLVGQLPKAASVTPALMAALAGMCAKLEMDKPPTVTLVPQGKSESIRVRIDNKGTCASLPTELQIRVGDKTIGSIDVNAIATKTGRTLFIPVDASQLPIKAAVAEVVNAGVVLGKVPIQVIVGDATKPKPDLAVSSVSILSSTNAKPVAGAQITVKAVVANQGFGKCATQADCTAHGDLTIRFSAPNVDDVVVKIADKLKAGQSRNLEANLKVSPTNSGEVIPVTVSIDPDSGGDGDLFNNERTVMVPTAYSLPEVKSGYSQVTVKLTKLECLNEDDLTSVDHGDYPYMFITSFSPADPVSLKKKWADVEDDKASAVQNIDYTVLDHSLVNPNTTAGFHLSLFENDSGLQDPFHSNDDEIDFTYVAFDWTEAESLQGKGPQKRTYDLKLVDRSLWGWPVTHYRVHATVEFGAAQYFSQAAGSNTPRVPIKRWGGHYEMIVDGDIGTVDLQANQPTLRLGLVGEFYGYWTDSKGTKRWISTDRLWGNMWQFSVHPDGAASWVGAEEQRFVGYLMGDEGQESVAGTTWSIAGNTPWKDDSRRSFLLRRKVSKGGAK